MDEGKVEESGEADGDGEDEDGIEDKEEGGVRPVNEEVDGHVLRADFGELVEARVEKGQDARRRTEGDCGGGWVRAVRATLSGNRRVAATCSVGGFTTTQSVLSATHRGRNV